MSETAPESGGTPQPPQAPTGTGSGTPTAPTTPTIAPSAPTPPKPAAAPVERTPEQELAHWREMARKNEERAKENAGAAAKLKKIEDAAKSDLERANDALAEAQQTAANERAERLRLLAAASHDLGPDFLDFLGGGTEDEINSRAERLANLIKSEAAKLSGVTPNGGAPTAADAAKRALNGRPAESLRPGAAPAGTGRPANNNDYFRSMMGQQ